MRFINSGNMDFEIPQAKLSNYYHGNIIFPINLIINFEFPSNLQNEDFNLQKLVYDGIKMTYSFVDYLLLDNSHKKTGFFETYDLATELDKGVYRIKAGNYYSTSLITINVSMNIATYYTISDDEGDTLVDNDNDNLIEPI